MWNQLIKWHIVSLFQYLNLFFFFYIFVYYAPNTLPIMPYTCTRQLFISCYRCLWYRYKSKVYFQRNYWWVEKTRKQISNYNSVWYMPWKHRGWTASPAWKFSLLSYSRAELWSQLWHSRSVWLWTSKSMLQFSYCQGKKMNKRISKIHYLTFFNSQCSAGFMNHSLNLKSKEFTTAWFFIK